jgi:hypothetical protein
MVLRSLIAAIFTLTVVGCDGEYTYAFHGKLLDAADQPARDVSVGIARDKFYVFPPTVETDSSGEFWGRFFASTGWTFVIRPPAPKLNQVWLYVRRNNRDFSQMISVQGDEPIIHGIRQLDVGTIRLQK